MNSLQKDQDSVAAIILIHRAADLEYLRRGINSLHRSSYKGIVIVIVDNNSGISQQLREEFSDAIVITSVPNVGFAGGCNVGIRYALDAGASYILLLNVDAVVEPDAVAQLVDGMKRHRDAGAFQPLIFDFDQRRVVDSAGQQPVAKGGAIDIKDWNNSADESEIFGVCAAVGLYRSEVFTRVGMFDDSFFIIHEDTDLSMRMRLAAFRSFLLPAAVAYHSRGVSGKDGKRSPQNVFFAGRNNLVLLLRYWPLRYFFLYLPFHCVRYARVFLCAAQCGYSMSDVHTMLLRALRDRSGNRSNPRMKEIEKRWMMKGIYRDAVKNLFHLGCYVLLICHGAMS